MDTTTYAIGVPSATFGIPAERTIVTWLSSVDVAGSARTGRHARNRTVALKTAGMKQAFDRPPREHLC